MFAGIATLIVTTDYRGLCRSAARPDRGWKALQALGSVLDLALLGTVFFGYLSRVTPLILAMRTLAVTACRAVASTGVNS